MNSFNELFPAILLAYVADVGCELTNSQCNELSKYVAQVEFERDNLKRAIEEDQKIINEWVGRFENQRDRCVELELRLDAYNGNMIDVLQAENERLTVELEAAKPKWIPVSEMLPEDGVPVLMATVYSHVLRGYHYSQSKQWTTDGNLYYHSHNYNNITHWMPLPALPEDNEPLD